jgi:hypothetical protein
MMKRLAVVAALATIGLGSAACAGPTPSPPSAGDPNSGPSASGPSAGSSASAGVVAPTGGPLAPGDAGSSLLDRPCSLLSTADLERLKASSLPSASTTGPGTTCDFLTGAGSVEVAVAAQGLAQAQFPIPPYPVTIGHHQAVKSLEPTDPAGCQVTIAVTADSRIDITTESTDDHPTDPCAFTMQAATLVEPHLPAG